jgi:secreted trypsin-like serine protease
VTEDGGPVGTGPAVTGPAVTGPAGGDGGTCKCGVKKTTRIVGGTETEVNEYPWIAAFDFSGTSGANPGGCAATLISTNWAVTASHCFFNPSTGELEVTKDTMSLVLGVHDRTGTTDTNRQVLTIAEIVLHPSYTFSGSSNDIALLKISETVNLNDWSPACLPTSGADFTGQNGWVYGWGATSEGGSLADKLLELEVPIVSDSVCESAMSSSGVTITSDMLCAGGENGKDACGGDSGGPFTVADSGSGAHTLVGAVSFGVGCAREGLYGVYADIPFFRTWIDETIAAKGGATFCS